MTNVSLAAPVSVICCSCTNEAPKVELSSGLMRVCQCDIHMHRVHILLVLNSTQVIILPIMCFDFLRNVDVSLSFLYEIYNWHPCL